MFDTLLKMENNAGNLSIWEIFAGRYVLDSVSKGNSSWMVKENRLF